MNLADALDDSSGQQKTPIWPGQPPANPVWNGGQSAGGGMWPDPQPTAPGGWPSPASGPGGWAGPASGPGPSPAAQHKNLAVPYQLTLPNGVYDKLLLTIAGTIKPNADRITVDMSTPRDLAFHLNPRFNENGKKVIVRNSCIAKRWGPEERELQHFPFVQGQPFEIKILCTPREYKVAVNNSHLLTYRHRITDLRSINAVSIYNDLTLSKVHMETLP